MTCLGTVLVSGQDSGEVSQENRLAIKVGYYGDFVMHPGLTMGIDYTLYTNKWFNLHWDTEMGSYVHKWNNNALFVQSSIGTRFTGPFSLCVDLNLGLGYMLTTPNGDVYRVDENDNLALGSRPFQSHLKPTFSILFGWNGERKRDIPLIIQTGFEAYMQSAYNHTMLPHAALRLGVIYRLDRK